VLAHDLVPDPLLDVPPTPFLGQPEAVVMQVLPNALAGPLDLAVGLGSVLNQDVADLVSLGPVRKVNVVPAEVPGLPLLEGVFDAYEFLNLCQLISQTLNSWLSWFCYLQINTRSNYVQAKMNMVLPKVFDSFLKFIELMCPGGCLLFL
jgi:hypothetical protein